MRNWSRRALLAGCIGGAAIAAVTMANNDFLYELITPSNDARAMSAPDAHAAALRGDIILIDIRRPDEWAATGSGEGAHRVDLRRDDFVDVLTTLTRGDKDASIALICARGVRSARTANRLAEAGFTRIIDVPEGMLGSAAGPGWLARELPLNLGS